MAKFQNYRSKFNVTLAIACILDPRYKLQRVEFYYRKIYDKDYSVPFGKVKDKLNKLFDEYKSQANEGSSNLPSQSHGCKTQDT